MRTGMNRMVRELPVGAGGLRRWGFTLVELLTIVVILGLLISLTTPSILQAKKDFAMKESLTRMHMLEAGIRMYAADWQSIVTSLSGTDPDDRNPLPPSTAGKYLDPLLKGRTALVQALFGYEGASQDGKDGPGARWVVPGGKVYGPYVGLDMPTAPSDPTNANSPPAFIDAFGNSFYYFRCKRTKSGTNYVMAYQPSDNDYADTGGTGPDLMGTYLRPQQVSTNALYRVDYLLITPGADRVWETFPTGRKRTDDVANFEFQFK